MESDGRLQQGAKGIIFRSRANDAQRSAVLGTPQTRKVRELPNETSVATLLVLGALLTLVPPSARAASGKESAGSALGTSAISGVVRDVQGVAQMGALVQIVAPNAMTVATAFTDQHGCYVIHHLASGNYLVRASATLFVPASRSNLQLRTGATAVVNLTLSALFDTAAWLPAQRRRGDESEDDWKWTLRSTANRPILRIVDDGSGIEVARVEAPKGGAAGVKALIAAEGGDGGFGHGGIDTVGIMHREVADGGDLMMRASVGMATAEAGGSQGREFDLGYETRAGFDGGVARTVVSYVAHPELMTARSSAAGVQVMTMTSAQRRNLGERVEVEAGGRLEVVNAGESGVAMQPFLRVSARPAGSWTLEYELATERELQAYDDVTSGEGEVPVALVRNGKFAIESGHHQEIGASHRSGRTNMQIAVYHDALTNVTVAGGESGTSSSLEGPVPASMLFDPTTGSFRALAAGYVANGARVTASAAVTQSVWVAAEYSSGEALASGFGAAPVSFAQALSGLKAQRSQTATIAVKGKLLHTGTRVRASYRWQGGQGVTAVDPYSSFGDQAYLGCRVQQAIGLGHMLPQGLEATIDVTNLLAQGYRPFVSADGQTLYFAQSPRTIQAGLSFSF